jgi:hypothetical protein
MSKDDHAPEHLRAWEALPWIANGRATPEQAALVEAHLPHCADCREELEWQRRMQAALQRAVDTADADAESERSLQALMARLDDAPEQGQPAAGPRSKLTFALAAAVVLQAVGIGALSLQLWSAEPDDAYRTLSSEPASPPATSPAATLRVLPDPGLSLAEWQALLQAQGLQAVGGPNSAGAYALAPAPGATALPRDEALAALRASPGVRLAEPIGASR